jgi:hypothetical protein
MIDQSAISALLKDHSLIMEVTPMERGHLRLETAFRYPDGSQIDLFLADEGPMIPVRFLTDFGNTSSWLLDLQVKPWLSSKRRQLLDQALGGLGVNLVGGALELELPQIEHLLDGVVRLGHACIRMADLHYTRRSSLSAPMGEALEDIFNDAECTYESDIELDGRQGKPVKVDYRVFGARKASLVMTMGTGNASVAHSRSNEIFRTWYDLNMPQRPESKVTIFDDSQDVYREEDLIRLKDFSDVVPLSDRRSIRDLLAA